MPGSYTLLSLDPKHIEQVRALLEPHELPMLPHAIAELRAALGPGAMWMRDLERRGTTNLRFIQPPLQREGPFALKFPRPDRPFNKTALAPSAQQKAELDLLEQEATRKALAARTMLTSRRTREAVPPLLRKVLV